MANKAVVKPTEGLYVRSTAKVIYGREKLRKKEKPGLYVRSAAKVIYGREKLRKKEKPVTLQEALSVRQKEKPESGASWNIKDERRIVLVGKTGCGKSSTGNTILGEEYFESDCSAASVTTVCNGKLSHRFGRHLLVVDTPELFDTSVSKVLKQIEHCIRLTSPGPHAFLLVIAANRFTDDHVESLQLLERLFGENMYQHLIVLFTRVDDMKKGYNHFIQNKLTNNLRILIQRCNNRHIGFNNNAPNQQDVEKLLDMIEGIVRQNNGKWYSNEVFKKVEKIIQEDKALLEKKITEEKRMLIRAVKYKSIEVQAAQQNEGAPEPQDIQKAPRNIVKVLSSQINEEEMREVFRNMKESTDRPNEGAPEPQDIQKAPRNIVKVLSSQINEEEMREVFRNMKESTERPNEGAPEPQDIQKAPRNTVKVLSSQINEEEMQEVFRNMKESIERPKSRSYTNPTLLDNYEQEMGEIKIKVIENMDHFSKPERDDLIRKVENIYEKYMNDENGKRQYLRNKSVKKEEGFFSKMKQHLKKVFTF